MSLSPERIRQTLQNFDFPTLFVEELGWGKARTTSYPLPGAKEVAHLGEIPAIQVASDVIPDIAGRKVIHAQIAKVSAENLLIFTDKSQNQQLWSWVKRDGSKSIIREHPYVKGQPGDLFLSKLAGLFVDMEEYDQDGNFSVLKAGAKLRNALDVSKVTKKFYGNFKGVHLDLASMIEGLPSEADKRWYASVLLNRLMFVYFLQQKGFLDVKPGDVFGDPDYLENRFDQNKKGNIYEDFLKPLFFKAFALPDGHPDKVAVLKITGKIRYLNGGLFLPHALESHPITLKNEGPLEILQLFKSVTWYLNDLPGADDNAMSPDVLGYIFEKYINDQKSAGAYYTPPEITEYLCERTIGDFVLDRVKTIDRGNAASFDSLDELLLRADRDACWATWSVVQDISVLDPAVGSGAFLVAALKTLTDIQWKLQAQAWAVGARDLSETIRDTGNTHREPLYAIRKRIITRNLYGVDLMAESTEIARLRLFLSLVASARTEDELEPLPNIEFNILSGNSLIGMVNVEDKDFIGGGLFVKQKFDELEIEKRKLIKRFKASQGEGMNKLVHLKDEINQNRAGLKKLCDGALWEEFVNLGIKYEQAQSSGKPLKKGLEPAHVRALQPFHWGSEFLEVLENGGFDAILTNPPWEIWKPNSKEFFQTHSDVVTKKKMTIKEFETHQAQLLKDPEIAAAWRGYLSQFPHVSEYFRKSKDYQNQISVVNGKKAGTDINLYKLFLERCFHLLKPSGRCGIVIPSSIYTDLGAKKLREMLLNQTRISGLFGLSNEKYIFDGVHHAFKICFLSFAKGGETTAFSAAFRINPREAVTAEKAGKLFRSKSEQIQLTAELIKRLSPASLSIMDFKGELDIAIAEKTSLIPTLGEKITEIWDVVLSREFDMTMDSHLFKAEPKSGRFPLFEGKMIHQFTHQWAEPKYWIDEGDARNALLNEKSKHSTAKLDYQYDRLGYREVTATTNSRTMIAGVIPKNSFCNHKINFVSPIKSGPGYGVREMLFLSAIFNSLIFDYLIRQRINSSVSMFVMYQMPVPRLTPSAPKFTPIVTRAAKLICTKPEFDDLAKSAGIGSHRSGATDEGERAKLRAELDAIVAKLYNLTEAEFVHILSTFPLVAEPVKLAARNKFRDLERGVFAP